MLRRWKRRTSMRLRHAVRKLNRKANPSGLIELAIAHNWRLVGLLTLGCALLTASGYFLVHRSVDNLLRAEAERTAQEWAQYFVKRIPDLEAIANGAVPSLSDMDVMENVRNMGSVFLFKLFDRNGHLRLVADKKSTFAARTEALAVHNAQAAQAVQRGRIFVDFMSGAGKANRPAHYSEAYVPIVRDGHTVAVVEVYVDQTARYAEYRASAASMAAIAALLAALAFGLPALALYKRSRQVARADERVHFLAKHDALTGLPNRALLNERLEQAMARALRGEIVAIHMLDLDHFKHVNDALGHPVGDKLLQMVSQRLRTLIRETDTVARMGGDEFAVVQCALTQAADATTLAQRIVEVVSEPYEIDGHQAVIGASIGIALAPSDGVAPDQMIRNADLALYRAKADGRAGFRFFEATMDARMQERRLLERDLRKAMTAGEFELHYQPIVSLATDEITGFEALVRWHHPEKGLVSPGTFIPLAEEIGLIIPLGEWVIKDACRTAAHWPADLRVAVNLSPAQFRSPGLLAVVVGALAASGLPANRLELEITETVLLQNNGKTLDILRQIHELGVRIAMDDFGTGYSSLSYLQSFPFDKIKIDRSFVKDITESSSCLNIVRAVAALAKGLGVTATAEGVETKEQLAAVTSEGCDEMQGFLKSKPLPASEIERLFLADRRKRESNVSTVAA